jgi:hypothetical protein
MMAKGKGLATRELLEKLLDVRENLKAEKAALTKKKPHRRKGVNGKNGARGRKNEKSLGREERLPLLLIKLLC